MSVVFISIGSNLGNRVQNCLNAIEEICSFSKLSAVSSAYETEPVGVNDQPWFVNCVVKIETALSPLSLLKQLQDTEQKLGRRCKGTLEPRTIDLDIVFYDNLVFKTQELVIPHPRAHKRRFVLEPMCEIEPDFLHPVIGLSIRELLNQLVDYGKVIRIGRLSTTYPQKITTYSQT